MTSLQATINHILGLAFRQAAANGGVVDATVAMLDFVAETGISLEDEAAVAAIDAAFEAAFPGGVAL